MVIYCPGIEHYCQDGIEYNRKKGLLRLDEKRWPAGTLPDLTARLKASPDKTISFTFDNGFDGPTTLTEIRRIRSAKGNIFQRAQDRLYDLFLS